MVQHLMKKTNVLFLMAILLLFTAGIFSPLQVEARIGFLRLTQDWDWDDDWDEDWRGSRAGPDLRYNRVQGVFLGVHVKKDYFRRRDPSGPFLYGSTGYSFKAKEIEYRIGLEKGFFEDYRLAFGGEYHRLIETPDRWIISNTENSLAAFFLNEDFHDFYFCEGWSGYVTQNLTDDVLISVGYHYDELDSLAKNTDWSLFGGKKKFDDNPAMVSGEMRSIIGRLVVDTRNRRSRATRGWYLELEGEHAGNGLNGDFKFDRVLIDIRRYQPLWIGEGIDFRVRVGTSHGVLPWHRSYHLGGISTLRGFPYKAFPNGRLNPGGNRMVLAQVEYRMGSQDLPDEIGLGLFEYFNFILFFDIGWVGTASPDAGLFGGFDDLCWSNLKNDVGIALANRSGSFRLQLARRTDTGHKPFVFSFRINRPF